MAVKIKLKRLGKIRRPQYRIIVADARTKRDGRAIEEVGYYDAQPNPSVITVDSARIQYWLGVGATPTDAVRKLLSVTGDWQKFTGVGDAAGTLEVAAPKADRGEAFAAAVAEAQTADNDAASARAADAVRGAAKAADDVAEAAEELADVASEAEAAAAESAAE